MPNRQSAVKSLKQTLKRTRRNKGVKTRLKTETKMFDRAVERRDVAEAEKQIQVLTKLLQQAAAKGVVHKNAASRRQSRLTRRLNEVKASA